MVLAASRTEELVDFVRKSERWELAGNASRLLPLGAEQKAFSVQKPTGNPWKSTGN